MKKYICGPGQGGLADLDMCEDECKVPEEGMPSVKTLCLLPKTLCLLPKTTQQKPKFLHCKASSHEAFVVKPHRSFPESA